MQNNCAKISAYIHICKMIVQNPEAALTYAKCILQGPDTDANLPRPGPCRISFKA